MTLAIGARVGQYEILGALGAGGMGEVYKARDSRLHRTVAIKVLPAEALVDAERRQRFIQEAKAASALNHPNIVHIYGIESSGAHDCIVMEYVEGGTLHQILTTKPLPLRDALHYAVQIADALASAHAAGIVHRDIKPSNIMVTAKGLIKVLDFGLAKLANPAPDATTRTALAKTRAGIVVGTAPYMSPEQAQGQPVDVRSDIFSFGTLLYELVTGRRAFAGNSDIVALSAILNTDPRPPSQCVRGVPPALDHLVSQCLRKDPRRRMQHMEDVKIELEQIRDDVTAGVPRSRTPWMAIAATAAAVLVTIAAAVLLWRWTIPPQADRTAGGPLTRLTSDSGLTTDPALSPDGRLVAFASDRAGEDNLDIWVQQVAAAEPMRLTRHPADEWAPVFSPDGTQIAFRSERDGGGIYLVSALGGDPILLAPQGFGPRFSPDGQWLAYHTGIPGASGRGRLSFGAAKLYIVRPTGGPPRQIQAQAKTATVAVWSPDSRHLLIQASFETGVEADDWWITPLEGTATPVSREPLVRRGVQWAVPVAWLPGNRIVFSGVSGDSQNHWIVGLASPDWQIEGLPERLTFGAGTEGTASVAVSEGVVYLAFSSVLENIDLWSVPLARDGLQPAGPPGRLTHDAAVDVHPTLSADGQILIYSSTRNRRRDLWVGDGVTGREMPLLSMPPNGLFKPVISRDGRNLAFWRIEGGGEPSIAFVTELTRGPDGSLRADTPQQLPNVAKEGSGWPWSWSPSGDALWYDPARWPRLEPNYLHRTVTGKRVAEFGHAEHDLAGLELAPDGRRLTFLEPVDDTTGRLVAAAVDDGGQPVGPTAWTALATGDHSFLWNAWSPAGDVVYYESNSDGYVCVWAQRLAPKAAKPLGPPVAIYHAHSARLSIGRIGPNLRGLAAARDRLVFNMMEMTSNIWMTAFSDDRRSRRGESDR